MKDKIKEDKQPFENIEELPCDVIDQQEFEEEVDDQLDYMSVDVDVFIGSGLGEEFEQAIDKLKEAYVARTTKRGTRFYAGDIKYDKEEGMIHFKAGTSLPKSFTQHIKYEGKKPIGTTFADFCFMTSDGTKFHTLDQCATTFRKDAEPGDLTWFLPAKFVDDMVEMMSIMNNLILCGTMEEAILYGPTIYLG